MAALTLRDVSVHLNSQAVVNHVSFAARAGAITAVVGPNGAGKSTLLKAIAGVLPYEGEIAVGNAEARTLAPGERARRISYLPQNHSVAWPMPAASVVALGRLPHLPAGLALSHDDRAAVERAIERADLEAFRDRRVDSLSQGERSRVLFARAIATEAPVLLADEPIAALDPYYQLQMMDLMRDEAARGAAVVVVLHDLALTAAYAAHAILMHRGHVVDAGAPAEVLTEKALCDVYRVKPAAETLALQPPFRRASGE